jgi:hypothetical protein
MAADISLARTLWEKADLPHNTVRQRHELLRQGMVYLCDLLGSPDYLPIGEVHGGGDARADMATLREALCEKAAKKGGDVVMVFDEGVQERPYVYTTPGYARTHVYGSTYRTRHFTYGSRTGYTTYYPGQTYTGVHRYPYASGLVFKYVPGFARRREALDALSDAQLAWALGELDILADDDSVSLQEALQWYDAILAEAQAADEQSDAAPGPASQPAPGDD